MTRQDLQFQLLSGNGSLANGAENETAKVTSFFYTAKEKFAALTPLELFDKVVNQTNPSLGSDRERERGGSR